MKNFVIGKLMGRCGNQFYQIATTYAYARKHDFDFFVSPDAPNCDNNAYYFKNLPTKAVSRVNYEEPRDSNGNSYFHEIPKIENVYLIGYWQSFDFFNDYREEILNLLNLPYEFKKGYISLHVRRGDYLELKEKLSIMPLHYYSKCIDYLSIYQQSAMQWLLDRIEYNTPEQIKIQANEMFEQQIIDAHIDGGNNKVTGEQYYNETYGSKNRLLIGNKFKYLVFSDDIEWCKSIFNEDNFPKIEFEFSEGRNELEDLSLMASCEHNICANSTFSYAASWLNRNENKLVFTPDINNMFGGCNLNMIPDNYIKIKI